jgi:hypothetical protein
VLCYEGLPQRCCYFIHVADACILQETLQPLRLRQQHVHWIFL